MRPSNELGRKYQHFNVPGHAHALNFSCFRNLPLLKYAFTKQIVAQAIIRAGRLHDFAIVAWLFMPDHVHLLIFPRREEYSISDILRSIKQSSANKAIPVIRERSPKLLARIETGLARPRYRFWQDGGGYDRNLRTQDAILAEVQYIHDNPVKKGLVMTATEWKWGSARGWLVGEKGEIPLDLEILKGL